MAMLLAALSACGGGGGSGELVPVASAPATADLSAPLSLQVKAPPSRAAWVASKATVVNATTAGEQTLQAIGSLADGGYAVAWLSLTNGGADPMFYLQRYDALGKRAGGETLIPFSFADARMSAGSKPAVAVLADGSIVVAYASNRLVSSSATSYYESSGIYLQRFDLGGTPLGGETAVYSFVRQLVNARQLDSAVAPVVLSWPDGSYLVGWNLKHDLGYLGIYLDLQTQRFDPQGAAVGQVVNFSGGGDPCASFSLKSIQEGGYIVARTYCATGGRYLMFSAIDSNTHSGQVGSVNDPDGLPPGSTLVALTGAGYALWSRSSSGAYVQMLDNTGTPSAAPTPVDSLPFALIALNDGGYLALSAANASAALAQGFDSAGSAVGEPIETAAASVVPSGSSLIDGGVALAWTALSAAGDQDVMTQLIESSRPNGQSQQANRRACLADAKEMTGQERSEFMAACLVR